MHQDVFGVESLNDEPFKNEQVQRRSSRIYATNDNNSKSEVEARHGDARQQE